MKIKHQLAIFNVITRISLILILVLLLPVVVKTVVYKHINKTLIEKKQKFIEHLGDQEINEFMDKSDDSDTYASFSILHDEFILLSKIGDGVAKQKSVFVNEPRIMEHQEDEYRILQYTFGYSGKIYQLEVGRSLGEIKELTFMVRIFTLATLLVIVLLTFLMDSFFIEYLFAPFKKIIDTKMRRVNDPDSFNFTKINSHSNEFRELDEVLNQMMERIDTLFKQEKQFIANVSHELLSPISMLKNRFENLLQNESLNDEAFDKIAGSLKTLDLLKKIINNLLLISKIENNQFAETEAISVTELLHEIATDVEDRTEALKIDFSIELKSDFVFSGNKTLLHILFFNLISNAIKYNHEKGTVVITDSWRENLYTVFIKDSGKGMTEEQLKQIFERFTRLDFEQDGQGLGLAIVNSIVHFHHLTLDVVSIPDLGSTFSITFASKEL